MELCKITKRVIKYCEEALEELRIEEPTGQRWERRWASLISLLRTACEVLEQEAPSYWHTYMKAPNALVRGRDRGRNWKPDIFGKFIWKDANLFLHEGHLTTGQSIIVSLQGVSVQGVAAGEQVKPLRSPKPVPPPIVSYRMTDGHYQDRDPRDVAHEAIDWLMKQVAIAEAP